METQSIIDTKMETQQSSQHSNNIKNLNRKKPHDKRKIENIILLSLSVFDLIVGIFSLIFADISVQILATIASFTTCVYAFKFFLTRKYERKQNGIMLVIGILDVMCGILSVTIAVYSVHIIAAVASGLPFFKALKIFVQSEKGIKVLEATKPIIVKILIQVAPMLVLYGINKLKKLKTKINKKGEHINMNKFQDVLQRLIAYLKRNVKTNIATIGNALASLGAGGLIGGGMYVGEVAIPIWATSLIGIIVSIIIFVVNELGIRAKGVETQEEFDTRIAKEKAIKDHAKALAEMEAEKIKVEKDKQKALIEMKAQKAKDEKEFATAQKAKAEAEKKAQEEKELAEWLAQKQANEAVTSIAVVKIVDNQSTAEPIVIDSITPPIL